MADYGAYILMDNGNPFVTPQSTPFCLYAKLTANSDSNGNAAVNIALDASYPAIVFCKTTHTAQPTLVTSGRVGNTIGASSRSAYGQAHTLTAYIFAIFPQTLPKWGFAIWDAAGKLVLTNESRVLSDLVTIGTPGVNGGINIDQTLTGSWAVSPGILGSLIVQNNSTSPPTIINITTFSGARFDGASTRINAAPNTTANGVPVGSTNTGITLTAINTAAYD